jgi:tryptophanyl-tRNA synthetase
MGLDNPLKKMSKSAKSSFNYISLGDSPEKIKEKIKRAVTDSGKEIRMSPKKPAISNLLNIYSLITDKKIPEIEKDFKGKNYNEFKEKLAEELIEQIIRPFQSVKRSYLHRRDVLLEWLDDGKRKAERIAKETIEDVKRKVGLFI